jgi:hypothetical protein
MCEEWGNRAMCISKFAQIKIPRKIYIHISLGVFEIQRLWIIFL